MTQAAEIEDTADMGRLLLLTLALGCTTYNNYGPTIDGGGSGGAGGDDGSTQVDVVLAHLDGATCPTPPDANYKLHCTTITGCPLAACGPDATAGLKAGLITNPQSMLLNRVITVSPDNCTIVDDYDGMDAQGNMIHYHAIELRPASGVMTEPIIAQDDVTLANGQICEERLEVSYQGP